MNFTIVTNEDYEFFINELVNTFPEIKEQVLDEDWNGLIHLQIGEFTRFTQDAIDTNDIPVALKCFRFVEEIITRVSARVESALAISWVFHLSFTKNEGLNTQFPIDLKKLRMKLDDYHNSASKNKKLNKFLKNFEKDNG